MVCPEIDNSALAEMLVSQGTLGNQNYHFKANHEAIKIETRPKLSQPQDHIIAERKRREKLSQRFIALSALVPGLKKVLNNVVNAFSFCQHDFEVNAYVFYKGNVFEHFEVFVHNSNMNLNLILDR